jgi:hypothetical protein
MVWVDANHIPTFGGCLQCRAFGLGHCEEDLRNCCAGRVSCVEDTVVLFILAFVIDESGHFAFHGQCNKKKASMPLVLPIQQLYEVSTRDKSPRTKANQ